MSALLIAVALAASPEAALRVVAVDDASAKEAFLRVGERHALVALVMDGGRCLSAAPVVLDGRACEPLPDEAVRSLRWRVAVAEARNYDNVRACGGDLAALRRGCHAPLVWRVHDLAAAGQGAIEVSSFPELAVAGTHRLGVAIVWEGRVLASAPGLAGASGSVSDDAAPALFQLVVRRDDSYVGYLTEQLGTPFVFFPVRLPGGMHQTDARLGADCAALVVYGRRRMGERVPYVAPGGLRRFLAPVGDGPVRAGDVLHFGFQSAVLSRDLPPAGRLDPGDLVVHTFHGVAEEVPLGTVPYRGVPVQVLRWR